MQNDSRELVNYWLKNLFTAISSIVVVIWFQYPAQLLLWFFVIDVVIVTLYTFIQLLRFSSTSKPLLIMGGVAISSTLIPLALGAFAILVTQEIIQLDTLLTKDLSLTFPILISFATYYYITRSSAFTTNYFDKFKIKIFLLFTFSALFFGSWLAYSVHLFNELFAQYYIFGFTLYLLYKIIFDALVWHFFKKRRNSWDFILKD